MSLFTVEKDRAAFSLVWRIRHSQATSIWVCPSMVTVTSGLPAPCSSFERKSYACFTLS